MGRMMGARASRAAKGAGGAWAAPKAVVHGSTRASPVSFRAPVRGDLFRVRGCGAAPVPRGTASCTVPIDGGHRTAVPIDGHEMASPRRCLCAIEPLRRRRLPRASLAVWVLEERRAPPHSHCFLRYAVHDRVLCTLQAPCTFECWATLACRFRSCPSVCVPFVARSTDRFWATFGVKEGLLERDGVEKAKEILRVARAAGINLFDNAEAYGNPTGEAERILGQAISELRAEDPEPWQRSKIIITTKVALSRQQCGFRSLVFWGGSGENEVGLSRKHIKEGLDASLKNLQTDYVDLFFCHRPDQVLKPLTTWDGARTSRPFRAPDSLCHTYS
eukprot:scaffold137_cov398-Prasinococcus_capsulatus_cf.AAC.11